MTDSTTTYPAPQEWTISLAKPIDYNGGTFSELKLAEPTMEQLNKALAELNGGGTQQQSNRMQITLVTLVSGLPKAVVERMPWPVVVGAADWMISFTHAAPATIPS